MESISHGMILAGISGGASDAQSPLEYPRSTPAELGGGAMTPLDSFSHARQDGISATRSKMRALGESVQVSEMRRPQVYDGTDPPATTYEQGLAVLERFFRGIDDFTYFDVLTLIRLSLAIAFDLEEAQEEISWDMLYHDILQWSNVIGDRFVRWRFLTTAEASWRPASVDASLMTIWDNAQVASSTADRALLITSLKKGLVIQMCLRHITEVQYARLCLETELEYRQHPPDGAMCAVFQRQIIIPLGNSRGLEPFQGKISRVAGLIRDGFLDSTRAVEVMLVGGLQNDHSPAVRTFVATVARLCSRTNVLQQVDPNWRDLPLARFIRSLLIDCQAIDRGEQRRALFGISSGLTANELGRPQRMGPISSSGRINRTIHAQRSNAGASAPPATTGASQSDCSTETCRYAGCTTRRIGATKIASRA